MTAPACPTRESRSPSPTPLLAPPEIRLEMKRRGRRRPEESEGGQERQFLPTWCWRQKILPARAGLCAQGIWMNAYPIFQWLVGVSLSLPADLTMLTPSTVLFKCSVFQLFSQKVKTSQV